MLRVEGMLRADGGEPFEPLCGAAPGTDDNSTALPSLALTICILHPGNCQRPLQHAELQGCTRWGHEEECARVPVPSCHRSRGWRRRRTWHGMAWSWQQWAILLAHPEPVTAEQ